MTAILLRRTARAAMPPTLLRALVQPRLTAAAHADGTATSWGEHVAVYGDPRTPERAGHLTGLLTRHAILGRGGAAFPLAVKMHAVRKAKGRPVVVVNASEGEPAIWKDRMLLSHVPHLVLDGAQLAAAALGADEIHVAVNPTYRPAHDALTRAITQRSIFVDDVAPVSVHVVADEFTAGEGSAVIQRINGGPGRPEFAKVVAAVRGVDGRPTLLSNAETFAQLAVLARLRQRYAEVGTPDEPGSTLFTVRGAVATEAVIEAPLGTRIGDLVAAVGGVTEPIQAVLVGGYHGRWLPVAAAWHAPLTVKDLRARGGALGAGLVAPLPADGCPLVEVARVVRYLANETAGQCGPCVNGLPAIADGLETLAAGVADDGVLDRLARWSGLVTGRGVCKQPDGTVGFVRSALDVFGPHVERHLSGPCGRPWRALLPVDDATPLPRQRSHQAS